MMKFKRKKGKDAYFQRHKSDLLNLLRFAKEHVPFYKKVLKNVEIDKIRTYKDFVEQIPIITPKQFSKNPDQFTSDLPAEFIRTTSGTTGKEKRILLTRQDLDLWSRRGRLTHTPYFKKGMTVAHSKRKEKHYLSNVDASVIESDGKVITFDPTKLEEVISAIKKADLIFDYAELIYYLGDKIKEYRGRIEPKKLILSFVGNKLTEKEIDKIQESFKNLGVETEIYSEYGTSEVGPIGSSGEKEHTLFKIVYEEIVFIEVVDPDTEEPSEEGDVLLTSLNRTGSLFIRYEIGDLGELYVPGHNHPLLDFHERKKGIKVASVYFTPNTVLKTAKNFLEIPLFCDIELEKDRFLSVLSIEIISEKEISEKRKKGLRKELLEKLELTDDLGSTVKFNLNFNKRKLKSSEKKKGFRLRTSCTYNPEEE